MSMFENKPRSGGKFANFKEGMIIHGDDSFTHLNGHIVDMNITDEEYPKGVFYKKVVLFIKKEDKVVKLGFPMVSGYGLAFFNLSMNIDFALPVEISGGFEKLESGNGWGKMFIKQNDIYVKHYFNKGTSEGERVPKVVETSKGIGKNKKVDKDYTDRDTFIETTLTDVFNHIKKQWPDGEKSDLSGLPF